MRFDRVNMQRRSCLLPVVVVIAGVVVAGWLLLNCALYHRLDAWLWHSKYLVSSVGAHNPLTQFSLIDAFFGKALASAGFFEVLSLVLSCSRRR